MKDKVVFVILLIMLFTPFTVATVSSGESTENELFSTSSISSSGGLGRVWEKTDQEMSGESIVVQGDYIYTFGAYDYDNLVITKWDSSGSIVWQNILSGDYYRGKRTAWGDGENLYITGYNNTVPKGFVVKFDSGGNIVWNTVLEYYGWSICGDNTYIYVADMNYLNKINPVNGSVIEDYPMRIHSMREDKQGLYLIEYTENGTFLKKWNDGMVIWSTRVMLSVGVESRKALQINNNSLYLLSQNTTESGLYLSKFNANGLVWNITDTNIDAKSFVLKEQGIYVVGSTDDSKSEFFLARYNFDGEELWQKTWRTKEYGDQGLYDIALGENDTVYTLGSDSEIVLTKWIYDTIIPIASSPEDIFYEQSDSGSILEWYVADENPSNFTVFKNNLKILEGSWKSGTPITCMIDRLSLGQYVYKLIAEDLSGNSISDTVIVIIQDTDSPILEKGVFSSSDQLISWIATDDNPGTYTISKDGDIIFSGNWVSGGVISVKGEIPETGSFKYLIIVKDSSGNEVSGSVTIYSPSSTSINISSSPSTTNNSSSVRFSSLQIFLFLFFVAVIITALVLSKFLPPIFSEEKKKTIANSVKNLEVKSTKRN